MLEQIQPPPDGTKNESSSLFQNAQVTPTPRNWMIYLVVGFSALGGFLFGYDTGVISGALLFMVDEFHLSIITQQVLVSITLVGAMIGAMVGGGLADQIGRKKSQLFASFLFVVGSLIIALAPHVYVLILGRLVVGVAIGVASLTVPLYIAEVAPTHMRGSLVSYNQLFITIGILAAYIVGYALSSSGLWRWMFGISIIPAFLQGAGALFIPESPRWFMKKNHEDLAVLSLRRLRGKCIFECYCGGNTIGDRSDTFHVRRECGRNYYAANATQWKSLVAADTRPAIIVGCMLAIIQQVTGINTVIYYSPTIINNIMQSESAAILASIAVGGVMVLATWLAVLIMDKVGRRILLLVGILGMSLSLLALSLGFFFVGSSEHIIAWVTVISLMVLGPIVWLILSEIYPLRVRGKAMSLATCIEWTANFIVSMTFLSLVELLDSSGAFLLYAVVGLLSLIYVYFQVPETKNKSLEEIEVELKTHGARKRPAKGYSKL